MDYDDDDDDDGVAIAVAVALSLFFFPTILPPNEGFQSLSHLFPLGVRQHGPDQVHSRRGVHIIISSYHQTKEQGRAEKAVFFYSICMYVCLFVCI